MKKIASFCEEYSGNNSGEIPGKKAGRRQWRFHKDTIDRWLSEKPAVRGLSTTMVRLLNRAGFARHAWEMLRVCRHVDGPAGKYSWRRNAKARAGGGHP